MEDWLQAICGWVSGLPQFRAADAMSIRERLEAFVGEANPQQVKAGDDSIPFLQRESGLVIQEDPAGKGYSAILEYKLPLEERRPDVIFLMGGAVVVLELKGKERPATGDIDQVAAYARDLRAYHRDCHTRPVHAVLVPTRHGGDVERRDGVHVVGPEGLHGLLLDLDKEDETPLVAEEFLAPEAYCPLPTLVKAARELFESKTGDVREIWSARAATDPAVHRIAEIAREAKATGTRRLILVSGVPGAGKTLVGLRAVHAGFLEDLAEEREGAKPTVPALFLSGNLPLVQVLHYELKSAGGGGAAFVRHIKTYLDTYIRKHPGLPPPEHLLVFDEAQRAFSKDKVKQIHEKNPWPEEVVASEPELFVSICERMPRWSVMIGLIGEGQEIYVGEEGGIGQWAAAIRGCNDPNRWTVHAPAELEAHFLDTGLRTKWESSLNLDIELRYHLAKSLSSFVAAVVDGLDTKAIGALAGDVWAPSGQPTCGARLWATRDLQTAKDYFVVRYKDDPMSTYGMVASSRDKLLVDYEVDNSFNTTKRLRRGPWFCDGVESSLSCRRLDKVATEFDIQGLELDMTLLCWGSDYRRVGGMWDDSLARNYASGGVQVKDPLRLRKNAYRVLLTRGRDGTIVFVPPDERMDETWEFLLECGFRELQS